MLILERKRNEIIRIGDDIMIVVKSVVRGTVRLAIQAPPDVLIWRSGGEGEEKPAPEAKK